MSKRKPLPPMCDGCEHLAGNLRTDFKPHTTEYFCGDPSFLELDSNEPGPWLGFIPVRHQECLTLNAKSVPKEKCKTQKDLFSA